MSDKVGKGHVCPHGIRWPWACDECDSASTHKTPAPLPVEPTVHRIEHDGFEGTVQGSYVTREGKRGVVLQQVGTKVVHVYGEKWLAGPSIEAETVKAQPVAAWDRILADEKLRRARSKLSMDEITMMINHVKAAIAEGKTS